MKRIDIFCASQASTAICMSMDPSSSTIHLGSSKAIDRHNPIIRDSTRTPKSLTVPCSSQPPISPKPHRHHQKNTTPRNPSSSSFNSIHDPIKKNFAKAIDQKRKSTCANKPSSDSSIKKSCAKPSDLIFSPPASSRYLLSDTSAAFFEGSSDLDPVLALVPVEQPKKTTQAVKTDDDSAAANSKSSSSSSRSSDQVVVLRVSLHCKGCEGKVRKHISRMEGVTSFNIDFASKKVTVVGDVTPLGVLASVSKVKSAQLWTPPAQPSQLPPQPPPLPPQPPTSVRASSNIEIKK